MSNSVLNNRVIDISLLKRWNPRLTTRFIERWYGKSLRNQDFLCSKIDAARTTPLPAAESGR
jgi:hypothetical protein